MNTLLRRYLLSICHRLHYEALPDKIFLHIKYYLVMGKKLNLDNPKTFTEKIQWLKLNNRKVEYTTMVDTNVLIYEVRQNYDRNLSAQFS